MEKLENQRHVVIVFPHPDDESFGTAGVIKQCREAGVPVTYLCGTLGEMGRNMGTPPFANRETLSEIREKELEEACDYLGINYRLLHFRDKTIEFEPEAKVIDRVKKEIEDINPSLVITHYPEHGVHPDHNALGEATIKAVGEINEAVRPVVWAAAITNNFEAVLGEPEISIPVQEEFDFKLNAILKHKSQAEGMLEKLNETPEGLEEYIEGLKTRLGLERFFVWNYAK
ncbi:MAG TPA: bacillithiol biosynthesis deacetylase BshB2 [Pseudogracilibacillus sp.]|nr:bacillithiol biosynthesis deacetylase BshB2 [Pseudogracilibacillus sp.]